MKTAIIVFIVVACLIFLLCCIGIFPAIILSGRISRAEEQAREQKEEGGEEIDGSNQ